VEQSRAESITESIINVGSGFMISLCLWIFVIVPIWKIDVTIAENFMITSMFTVVSIVRGYYWRRFFNAGIHRTVHKYMTMWRK